jgi:hypothetical protein
MARAERGGRNEDVILVISTIIASIRYVEILTNQLAVETLCLFL